MTSTTTITNTYTTSDVKKVFECFQADLHMIARSTSLWSDAYTQQVAEDVQAFGLNGYIREIHVVLQNSGGVPKKAHRYNVLENTTATGTSRPAGNIWGANPGDLLTVVMCYSDTWRALPSDKQDAFRSKRHLQWSPSGIDLSYAGMANSDPRNYFSNGYGHQRTTYTL